MTRKLEIHSASAYLILPVPIPDKEKKTELNFIFTLLCGTSKSLRKVLEVIIKPFAHHKEGWKYNFSLISISILLWKTGSLGVKNLPNFIRPCAYCIFDIHNPCGIKLVTRLPLGLSLPHEHKFRHCFQNKS